MPARIQHSTSVARGGPGGPAVFEAPRALAVPMNQGSDPS